MAREEEIKLVAECAVTDEKYSEFKEGLIWGANETLPDNVRVIDIVSNL